MVIPAYFAQKLQSNRLPTALLLTGDGREEMANTLAAAYLCAGGEQRPCGSCLHCRKVAAGIHPDLLRAGDLKVDAIRALRSDAYIRPNEAERKVYLLPCAEDMNASAQNALLKLLEEGPVYAAFFFLVKNPESLLPTLRSRCELLRTAEGEPETFGADVAQFLDLLCRREDASLALLRFLLTLEKKSREELTLFLEQSLEGFTARLLEDPARLLPKLDALREIRAACEFNIGVGHLSGWMMASLC